MAELIPTGSNLVVEEVKLPDWVQVQSRIFVPGLQKAQGDEFMIGRVVSAGPAPTDEQIRYMAATDKRDLSWPEPQAGDYVSVNKFGLTKITIGNDVRYLPGKVNVQAIVKFSAEELAAIESASQDNGQPIAAEASPNIVTEWQ